MLDPCLTKRPFLGLIVFLLLIVLTKGEVFPVSVKVSGTLLRTPATESGRDADQYKFEIIKGGEKFAAVIESINSSLLNRIKTTHDGSLFRILMEYPNGGVGASAYQSRSPFMAGNDQVSMVWLATVAESLFRNESVIEVNDPLSNLKPWPTTKLSIWRNRHADVGEIVLTGFTLRSGGNDFVTNYIVRKKVNRTGNGEIVGELYRSHPSKPDGVIGEPVQRWSGQFIEVQTPYSQAESEPSIAGFGKIMYNECRFSSPLDPIVFAISNKWPTVAESKATKEYKLHSGEIPFSWNPIYMSALAGITVLIIVGVSAVYKYSC
jgi:hypothetical protein